MATPTGRPYRSKLKRPCDRCRTRRTACILPDDGPCRSCLGASKECTFELRPVVRRRRRGPPDLNTTGSPASLSTGDLTQRQQLLQDYHYHRHHDLLNLEQDTTRRAGSMSDYDVDPANDQSSPDFQNGQAMNPSMDYEEGQNSNYETGEPTTTAAATTATATANVPASWVPGLDISQHLFGSSGTPTVQRIWPLDQDHDSEERSTALLFGMSSESDPWLLRHFRYDTYGMRHLNQIHIRNAGGVPVEGLVPVHFSVTGDSLLEPAKEATAAGYYRNPEERRDELNLIVAPDHGMRLVLLFMKFIFTSMPVVSRSQLGLSSAHRDGSSAFLRKVPVHLLAALYASALPFAAHDPVLHMSALYEEQTSNRLWRIVYELVVQEIHTPKLAVLQAALLYLQQLPTGKQSVLSDSPFTWSFLGAIVSLAASLGLHLEPRPWGIPAWEKRLRRRLWWAVYFEDRWRSLLMGRPSLIREEEFDVFEPDGSDFVQDEGHAYAAYPPSSRNEDPEPIFIYAIRLAQIVDDVHETFYTLKASQMLSDDFRASIDKARPIQAKLQNWYSSLPSVLRFKPTTGNANHVGSRQAQGTAQLHFSYLVLEMFLYRAILRPLARSPPPPPISDNVLAAPVGGNGDGGTPWILDDLTFEGRGFDSLPAMELLELGDAAEAAVNASEKCAAIIVNFFGGLLPRDYGSFWHPWTRIYFAAISNFITLLFVQSPTIQHAQRSKRLLDVWSQMLRSQHKSHEGLMNLGLVRVNMLQVGGLDKNFILSQHGTEVCREQSRAESGMHLYE